YTPLFRSSAVLPVPGGPYSRTGTSWSRMVRSTSTSARPARVRRWYCCPFGRVTAEPVRAGLGVPDGAAGALRARRAAGRLAGVAAGVPVAGAGVGAPVAALLVFVLAR